MIRIIVQAILSAAGVIAALFLSPDDIGFPVVQGVVALLGIVVAAVLTWYGGTIIAWLRNRPGSGKE